MCLLVVTMVLCTILYKKNILKKICLFLPVLVFIIELNITLIINMNRLPDRGLYCNTSKTQSYKNLTKIKYQGKDLVLVDDKGQQVDVSIADDVGLENPVGVKDKKYAGKLEINIYNYKLRNDIFLCFAYIPRNAVYTTYDVSIY